MRKHLPAKRAMRKLRQKSENGQALVEFVICLPILMAILCAIVDFGWVFMNEYEANHATYEAARYASMHSADSGMTTSTLESNMKNLIENNLAHKSPSMNVSFSWPGSEGIATVTVTNPIDMLTFAGMGLFGTTFDVTVRNSFYVNAS